MRSWRGLAFGVLVGGVPLFVVTTGCGRFTEAGGDTSVSSSAKDGSAPTGTTTGATSTTTDTPSGTATPPSGPVAHPVAKGTCAAPPNQVFSNSSSGGASSGGSSGSNGGSTTSSTSSSGSNCTQISSGSVGFVLAPKAMQGAIGDQPVGDCMVLSWTSGHVRTLDIKGHAEMDACNFGCGRPCTSAPNLLVFAAGTPQLYFGSAGLDDAEQTLELDVPKGVDVSAISLCNAPGTPDQQANVVAAVAACLD